MKMEKEKIETQLQELQDIKDQKGEVKAPVAGVVTAIDAQVGARTAGTGDIRLADASAGARIVANFPSEYESYIQRGQPVEVTDKKETLPTKKNTQTKLIIGTVQAEKIQLQTVQKVSRRYYSHDRCSSRSFGNRFICRGESFSSYAGV